MKPSHRRRRVLFNGIVLLQTALLLATVAMVPATVVAQDPTPPGSQQEAQPSAEGSPEPSVEPEPEQTASPEPSSSAGPSPNGSLAPEASPDVPPSPPPAGSASPEPVASPSASPDPSPSRSVESPTPTAPAGPPAGTERNRVTLVAATDIDGNGAFDDLVTIESPPGTILRNVRAVPIPTDPTPPAGVFFPAGLFDYEVVVAEPGDPAAVTFHLPDGTVSQERRYRVLGPPERALVGPDSPRRRGSRHGRGHGDARRRRGRRRGPQRRRRHRGSGWSRVAPGRLEPHGHPPGSGRPHCDVQLLPRGMHRDGGNHGVHAPAHAPVGGPARRRWPHAPGRGHHAGDAERRTVVHVGQPRHRPPLPHDRGRDGQPARHGHWLRPDRLGGHGLRMRIRGRHVDRIGRQLLHRVPQHGRPRNLCPPPVGPTAPSPTAWSQNLARAAPSRPTRWATARPSASNQPLQGATMGLWRDLNGDGNFQPGGADGVGLH